MFVVHKPRDSVLFQCVFLLFVLMLSQTLVSAMASIYKAHPSMTVNMLKVS